MKRKFRWFCMVLAFLLTVSVCPAEVLAAEVKTDAKTEGKTEETEIESAEAKTLKLEKTEGEVTVENASGKTVTLRERARLYNGYQITTEKGYAWLSLDETKLIKLDWYSSLIIKKNKKKLEVLLDSGSLFFNVSKPLEEDETLDIRTSTMSTGVKGTLGKVDMIPRTEAMETKSNTSVELYEGKVVISYHEQNGSIVTRNIVTGEKASLQVERDNTEEAILIPYAKENVTEVPVKDAIKDCGFIAVEVKNDEALQQRLLEKDNGIDEAAIQEIIENAEVQLKQDQERAEEAAAVLENNLEKVNETFLNEDKTVYVDQVFLSDEVNTELTLPELPGTELKELEEKKEEEKPVIKQEETPKNPLPVPLETPKETYENKGGSSDKTQQSTEPVVPPMVDTSDYTVTFTYQGRNFAEEIIRAGNSALEPVLMPTESGYWKLKGDSSGTAYDFKTPVRQNLNLEWEDNSKN